MIKKTLKVAAKAAERCWNEGMELFRVTLDGFYKLEFVTDLWDEANGYANYGPIKNFFIRCFYVFVIISLIPAILIMALIALSCILIIPPVFIITLIIYPVVFLINWLDNKLMENIEI